MEIWSLKKQERLLVIRENLEMLLLGELSSLSQMSRKNEGKEYIEKMNL